MSIRDWIETGFALIGAANIYIILLVRYEVGKMSEKFLTKEDFDKFTTVLFQFMGATPISHRRTTK